MLIAIAEDYTPTQQKIKQWVVQQPNLQLLFVANNGYHFLQQLHQHKQQPQIVLVDISMPIMDGCTLSYYLTIHHPSIKIIALSSLCETDAIESAFLSGANAFVFKNEATQLLQQAIKSALLEKHYLDERLQHMHPQPYFVALQHKKATFWQMIMSNPYKLTTREITYLILIATALSHKQIAELMQVETRTVETFSNRLAIKLHINGSKALALFALKNGLSMQADMALMPVKKEIDFTPPPPYQHFINNYGQ